ncbi:hypothetical protein [Roseovarius sp.]|uniref:hypothetical protein n=1 Tax=Roseovarius sp. TaxID=1486281 RepID=UPI003D1229EF
MAVFLSVLAAGVSAIQFGALTPSGFGGTPISEDDGTYGEFTVSGGEITPNTSPLTVGQTTVGSTTVDVVAGTLSFKPDASAGGELASILALGSATISGKTIKGRAGEQLWVNSTFNNRPFTSEVTVTSHDDSDRLAFVSDTNRELRAPTNLRFYQCDFMWTFNDATANSAVAAIAVKGNIDTFTVEDCLLDGGLDDSIVTYGDPFTAEDYGWRGMLGLDGTSNVVGPYNVLDCTIQWTWRGLNMPGGVGVVSVIGCTFRKCSVDSLLMSGTFPNGRNVKWCKIKDPFLLAPVQVAVLSVDTANDRMTADSDRFGTVGQFVTINIGSDTTTPPAGTNLPGVGGSNDYRCEIISVSGGQTVLEFDANVDITDSGTDVFLNVEPPHADCIQFVPQPTAEAQRMEVMFNDMFGVAAADGEWSQGVFPEDIAANGVNNYYVDALIVGNMFWGANALAVSIYAPKRGVMADNTAVSPQGESYSKLARIRALKTWQSLPDNILLYNNASTQNLISDGTGLVAANHDVDPEDYASSGLFAGTGGYSPTTLEEFTAAFARTDLDGEIDYDARTYDLPSINAASSFTFTDETGATTSTQYTAGPQQITSITDSEGAASSYGALVSVIGGNSPEFRVTSDAGGSSVVTDWTDTPTIMAAGNYLWVRDTSSGSGSTETTVLVRVGAEYDEWSITTTA